MTTLTCNPGRDFVNSLGIPVDTLTLKSATDKIIEMARANDGRARLVSTLNVDFLVNSLGTAFTKPRHPELLEVLRGSDLVTADGFPIVWLSRLLGRPLPERVCGSDLVPAIAERAAREGLSIFLFGGADGVAEQAGKILQGQYPGLKIAGTAAPFVKTTGPGLAAAPIEDSELLKQIHDSGADILLVGLGNPKQELWFNRNRNQLRTPVSIGVGGTFSFITGETRRAPKVWQKLNLEWMYRMFQEPGRLAKRYATGLVKLAALATPVVLSRAVETLRPTAPPAPEIPLPWRRLWSSMGQCISILPLPSRVGRSYMERLVEELNGVEKTGELHIVDFSRVKHIALDAQQEFFNLAGLLREKRSEVQLMGLSKKVRRELSSARLLDLIEGDTRGALERLTERRHHEQDFTCESYSLGKATLVMLVGRVNRDNLASIGFVECLLHSIRDRACIIDFRNVDMLESSGIAEMMPLFNAPATNGSQLLLSGLDYSAKQMLRMSEIETNAEIIGDNQLLQRLSEEF